MLRLACVLSIALCIVPTTARALGITVVAPTEVTVGFSFDVELHLAGAPELADFTAPSVRAFDFDLAYDGLLLTYVATSFGPFLGTPIVQALIAASAAGGVVDLKEVSLLSSGALDALQPQDFLLATLTFEASAVGPVTIELIQRDLSDATGSPFSITGSSAASFEVTPEPGTVLLLGTGLLVLAGYRQRMAAEPTSGR
jgi:hypothetical protein